MAGRLNDSSPDNPPRVWVCSSRDTGATAAPEWLTTAESQRFAGLAGAPRMEFLASRWLIRRALAAASGHEARLCRPGDGRPDTAVEPPGWRLSISHSGGMAGCAVSSGSAIGLDIEPLTRRPDWHKLVRRWFGPREQAWLLAGNDPEAFLKVWTLKEAWLKATGRGIANNLQTLEVAADFRLAGDRDQEPWQASLGRSGNHLVALVYQGPRPPQGHCIAGRVDITDPDAPITGIEPFDWMLHRRILCPSDTI